MLLKALKILLIKLVLEKENVTKDTNSKWHLFMPLYLGMR
jgi:hypothetical protein